MLKTFHAPAWAWLLTVAGVALFATLGTWQLHRGLSKQQWLAQFQNDAAPSASDKNSFSMTKSRSEQQGVTGTPATTPGPVLSRQTPAAEELVLQRAWATGVYLADRQLFQDGQSREGRPGFHVWTPLRLEDGALLLVNRGWIPQPAQLTALAPPAAPEGTVRVNGWWRSLPKPGVRVGDDHCRAPERFPAIVVYPRQEQLTCVLGEPVLPGLLLLDARDAGGFIREWSVAGFPPERHFGYAVTWYGLGLTAVILFVVLNLKRNDQTQT